MHSSSTISEASFSSAKTAPALRHHKKSHEVATTLDVVPTTSEDGKHVDFTLRVTNNTPKTVELRFPSGQTHDFIVLDSLGRTVWRWSAGRMFTSAMQSKAVKSSDTLTIEDSWDTSIAHGQYVAVATLRTDKHPIERRVAFTLP
jgi:hypothetical protein